MKPKTLFVIIREGAGVPPFVAANADEAFNYAWEHHCTMVVLDKDCGVKARHIEGQGPATIFMDEVNKWLDGRSPTFAQEVQVQCDELDRLLKLDGPEMLDHEAMRLEYQKGVESVVNALLLMVDRATDTDQITRTS